MSMWGFDVSDIAKKAQEAAQAAQEASENLSSNVRTTDVSSYFNLDAMISDEDKKDATKTTDTTPPESSTTTTTSTTDTTTTASSTAVSIPEETNVNSWNNFANGITNNLNKDNDAFSFSRDNSSEQEEPTVSAVPTITAMPPTETEDKSDDLINNKRNEDSIVPQEQMNGSNQPEASEEKDISFTNQSPPSLNGTTNLENNEIHPTGDDDEQDNLDIDQEGGDEWDFDEDDASVSDDNMEVVSNGVDKDDPTHIPPKEDDEQDEKIIEEQPEKVVELDDAVAATPSNEKIADNNDYDEISPESLKDDVQLNDISDNGIVDDTNDDSENKADIASPSEEGNDEKEDPPSTDPTTYDNDTTAVIADEDIVQDVDDPIQSPPKDDVNEDADLSATEKVNETTNISDHIDTESASEIPEQTTSDNVSEVITGEDAAETPVEASCIDQVNDDEAVVDNTIDEPLTTNDHLDEIPSEKSTEDITPSTMQVIDQSSEETQIDIEEEQEVLVNSEVVVDNETIDDEHPPEAHEMDEDKCNGDADKGVVAVGDHDTNETPNPTDANNDELNNEEGDDMDDGPNVQTETDVTTINDKSTAEEQTGESISQEISIHEEESTNQEETIVIDDNQSDTKNSNSDDTVEPMVKAAEVSEVETNSLQANECDAEIELDKQEEDSVDDLDDMYDDEDDETVEEEEEQPAVDVTSVTPDNSNVNETAPETDQTNVMGEVPQFAIEKFMSQLERLHVQHDAELIDLEKRHQAHVEELKIQLETSNATLASQKKAKSKDEVIAADKALAQHRQLEKEFNAKLLEKEEHNEGLQKQNEVLIREINEVKNEVTQLTTIREKRDIELTEMDNMQQRMKETEANLSTVQSNLDSANEAYATLKARTKTVALELKERRVECRGLAATTEELQTANAELQTERDDYRLKHSVLVTENEKKDEKIVSLETEISKTELELGQIEKRLTEQGTVGDKALAAYKRKAQASLSNANARAAAANQSREEAEIDAVNARNEAEIAKAAAKEAETEKKLAVSKAEEEVIALRSQVSENESNELKLKEEVNKGKKQYADALKEIDDMRNDKETIIEELNKKDAKCREEEEKNITLKQDFELNRIKMKGLQDELNFLKEEMEKNASVAFMARQNEMNDNQVQEDSKHAKEYNNPESLSETDGTIINLQLELKDANDAIRGLKEVLATILSKNPSLKHQMRGLEDLSPTASFSPNTSFDDTENMSLNQQRSFEASPRSTRENGNDSTPLFFAIEKQAELNTAREEVNRLAGLLGDAETAKTEAFDSMEEMRKKMEEAESRLRRYEKLGSATGPVNTSARAGSMILSGTRRHPVNGNTPFHSPMSSRPNNNYGEKMSSHNDSTVNLEYLKNIILRYLNAQTVAEKKSLVPVIAAVLELTGDEVAHAIKAQEVSFQLW